MTLLIRRLLIVVLALLALNPLSAKAAQQQAARSNAETSPVELIGSLYKVHRSGQGPFFNKKGKKYLPRFFDPTLAALIWKNIVETPSGEVGKLDFDPLYDTQDPVITSFRIGQPGIEGDRASVVVSFNNAGRKTKITFRLRKLDAGWRIENLFYGGGENLIRILSE